MQFDFVILSYYLFFFSLIVKCYPITYKDGLQEYNDILLYSMTWIIWCLTYNYIYIYIYFLTLLLLILFSICLPKKVIILSLSLSLSLSLYIYIYIYIYMRIMLITSRDKNPMIKCERKQLKIQKPQKV